MAKKSILGNDWMQQTGKYLFTDPNAEVNAESLKAATEKAEREQMAYVDRVMEKDKDCKSCDNRHLVPCNTTVILLPYEKNPYRVPLRETNSGLILGDFESTAMFKNPDSGEMEASEKGIWCCKVIAAGHKCENVKEGDDVFVNFRIAAPVPFGGKGYYATSEMNIICSIRENE